MNFQDVIIKRRSVRNFLDKQVDEKIIQKLLDSARHAPSSVNCQPWEFIVVKGQDVKNKIASSRTEDNQVERRAPVLIIVCADTNRSKSRWIEDGCAAAMNILLTAASLGLTGVWLTGWCGFGKDTSPTQEIMIKELNLPENIKPVCSLAIGYPAEKPEKKEFRDLKEMIHKEKW